MSSASYRFNSTDRRNTAEAGPHSQQSERFQATTLERNGDVLLVLPDWDVRHDRRVQRAMYLSDSDKLFWATIAIACGIPGGVTLPGTEPTALAKRYGTLEKARHDLDAMYQYYRPLQIGSPHIVAPSGAAGKSPGFFDCAAHMDNPTTSMLTEATAEVSAWLDENQYDPEFTSFQLNFFFSGHGDVDESGRPFVVLGDESVLASDLADLLLACVPEHEVSPSVARLDLYLDCCYSAGVARSILSRLAERQTEVAPGRSQLAIGQLYCASLDDEESFEVLSLSHSLFTFCFLNECSRKQPEGAEVVNLGLRDVGWCIEGKQHPLLMDFTEKGGLNLKFPSMFHVSKSGFLGAEFDLSGIMVDPLGPYLRFAHELRDACVDVERDLFEHPEKRVPFSRAELLENKKFPFL